MDLIHHAVPIISYKQSTSMSDIHLSAMASNFAPVLQNYIGSKGGSNTAALFAGALK